MLIKRTISRMDRFFLNKSKAIPFPTDWREVMGCHVREKMMSMLKTWMVLQSYEPSTSSRGKTVQIKHEQAGLKGEGSPGNDPEPTGLEGSIIST